MGRKPRIAVPVTDLFEDLFNEVAAAINEQIEFDPELQASTRARVLGLMKEHDPTDLVEMAALCHKIDAVLGPVSETIQSSALTARPRGRLLKLLKTNRRKVGTAIMSTQRREKKWKYANLSHLNRTEIKQLAKQVLSTRLGLPAAAPATGSREWYAIKSLFKKVDVRFLTSCGLDKAYGKRAHFESYSDLVVETFPEYKLANLYKGTKNLGKPVLDWSTRAKAISNTQKAIREAFSIPSQSPQKGSPEWNQVRNQLGAIITRDFTKWHISRAFGTNNKWFKSYMDVLCAAFPEYELRSIMERKKKTELRWRTPQEAIANVRKAVVTGDFGIPNEPPPKGAEEWFASKDRIISITSSALFGLHGANKTGISSSITSQFTGLDSYYNFLIRAFPEYELEERDFCGFRRFTSRIKTSATPDERELLEAYFTAERPKDTRRALERLRAYLKMISTVRNSSILEENEQFNMAFERLLECLELIKNTAYWRYSLKAIWKGTNQLIVQVTTYPLLRSQMDCSSDYSRAVSQGFPVDAFSAAQRAGIQNSNEMHGIMGQLRSRFESGRRDWEHIGEGLSPYFD
jgi:hypothetical protein